MAHAPYAVLGATYLWPWNVLLSAGALFVRQLQGHPQLQRFYSSSVMVASTVFGLAVTYYLSVRPGDYCNRVVYGLLCLGSAFALLAALCIMTVGAGLRFTLLLALVAAGSVGTSAIQNGAIAISQKSPTLSHVRSILIGQAVAGIVPAVLSLAVGASHPSPGYTGLLFLSCSTLAIVALYLFRSKEIEQHIEQAEIECSGGPPQDSAALKKIAYQIRYPAATIIIGFGLTLTYPVFANTVRSRSMPQTTFAPLTHLVWNLGDLGGRVLCQWKPDSLVHSPRLLLFYGGMRAVFIVLLLVLAWADNPNDLIYESVQFWFGFTNGQLITSAISIVPGLVDESSHSAAGGLIGLAISSGLCVGAMMSVGAAELIAFRR